MINKQQVKFLPKDKESSILVPVPKPAKSYIAQWFKDMPVFNEKVTETGIQPTAKKCMPFIDGLTSGYIQELPCDLEIIYKGKDDNNNDIVFYNWAGHIRPISTRLEEFNSKRVFPDFDGYYNVEFHWNTFWEPKTPKGYSTLYYHPANRPDLPFFTLNGIIDTDKWHLTGPLPVLIKKGFEGVIPAGTPIYQMIFIKRDEWESVSIDYDEKYQQSLSYSVRKKIINGYKDLYWNKKSYK